MKTILLFLVVNFLIVAQPSIVDTKIIELNQPNATIVQVNSIKKINETEFGAVGYVSGNNGGVLFAKFNYDSLIFSKTYSSLNPFSEAEDFEITNDSSFILVGKQYIYKISNNGDSLWCKEIENANPYYDKLFSVDYVGEDNYLACGYSGVPVPPYLTDYYIWLVKFNGQGEIIWEKKYHRSGVYWSDMGLKMIKTFDNYYLITGNESSNIFLLKIDSDGIEVFFRLYEYSNESIKSWFMAESPNSEYYITGQVPIWNNFNDILLIKTDSNGDTLFFRNYDGMPIGSSSSGDDYGVYIKILSSNNIFLGGNGKHRFTDNPLKIVIRLDSLGNVVWKHIIESENYSRLLTIEVSNENKLIYLGKEEELKNNIFIITTSYDVTNILYDELIPSKYLLSQNYPNPFNPSTTITYEIAEREFVTLKVYDILGREVATLVNEEKPTGSYEVEFDPASSIKNPASGIYFYKITAGDFIETKKMILLR
jgi:hypothetical protein